jgi:uncharacterized phiE125 gp8 family phage protein
MPDPTPAVATDLLSLRDARRAIPQAEDPDLVPDDFLADMIDQAVSLADDFCGEIGLLSQTYTEYVDATGSVGAIVLRHRPITAVASMTESPDQDPAILVAGTNFAFDGGTIFRLGGATFPSAQRALFVTYTAGYTSETCPGNLKRALINICTFLFEFQGNVGLSEERVGNQQYRYVEINASGLPPHCTGGLQMFRNTAIG